ncbi:CaiB/BaiF CoA-transferase family protein [Halorubrum trueperi]
MNIENTTIVDLTRLLPGPYATQLLSDLGAEVIKIEPPKTGDYARTIGQIDESIDSPTFLMLNRNKKSVVLDLKTDRGTAVFQRLIESADAVVEQFRPGVVDELGIGYEDVRRVNPDIVYCSITGYGQESPYEDRPGHDLNYIGVGGLLDMTRGDDGEVVIPGFPIADLTSGMFAAMSILAALVQREQSGRGEYIDISMADAIVSLATSMLGGPLMTGENPTGSQIMITGTYPCYGIYTSKDGVEFTLAAIEPKFWHEFCAAVERPDLRENHLSEDDEIREEVRDEVAAEFASRTRAELVEAFEQHDVPFGIVNSLVDVPADPHVQARDMVTGITHPEVDALDQIRFPAEFSNGLEDIRSPPPKLGEHTREILTEVGYTNSEIDNLIDQGIVE